jgi:hypothetical protein
MGLDGSRPIIEKLQLSDHRKRFAVIHCQLIGSLPECWKRETGTDWKNHDFQGFRKHFRLVINTASVTSLAKVDPQVFGQIIVQRNGLRESFTLQTYPDGKVS